MPYIELITPVGLINLQAEGDAIVRAFFSGFAFINSSEEIKRKKTSLKKATKIEKQTLAKAEDALSRYFAGNLEALMDIKIKPDGTAFQQKVWQRLTKIPPGKTISYGKIAQRIGSPQAARAVGQACGKNPILLFIPCHRVTRENSHLGGFSAGIKRKIYLLQHEKVLI